jgi:hypothetical protein
MLSAMVGVNPRTVKASIEILMILLRFVPAVFMISEVFEVVVC